MPISNKRRFLNKQHRTNRVATRTVLCLKKSGQWEGKCVLQENPSDMSNCDQALVARNSAAKVLHRH
jgi:hypothetical protein